MPRTNALHPPCEPGSTRARSGAHCPAPGPLVECGSAGGGAAPCHASAPTAAAAAAAADAGGVVLAGHAAVLHVGLRGVPGVRGPGGCGASASDSEGAARSGGGARGEHAGLAARSAAKRGDAEAKAAGGAAACRPGARGDAAGAKGEAGPGPGACAPARGLPANADGVLGQGSAGAQLEWPPRPWPCARDARGLSAGGGARSPSSSGFQDSMTGCPPAPASCSCAPPPPLLSRPKMLGCASGCRTGAVRCGGAALNVRATTWGSGGWPAGGVGQGGAGKWRVRRV